MIRLFVLFHIASNARSNAALLWITRESCVIVLRLLTTGRPVCAAVAQHPMIYAIRFQVHRISLRALLDPDRDVHVSTKHLARRELSEPGCFLLFLLILPPVAINADFGGPDGKLIQYLGQTTVGEREHCHINGVASLPE